ncbi:methyltransferase-like protein 22 [Thrips palmi]|uniref:Methyltransferase-like protein 22 n=1 Tax=Thrips palmi TaxID=161013 RepID=A0A6P8ZXE4_THRPL|nr:methyltransferase-like protein 22 [Thrips palmi]XP_034250072.1 methyltransferase-like protein 22 [Thrips palmi]
MATVTEHQVTSEIYADEGIAVGAPRAGGYVTTKFYFKCPLAPGEGKQLEQLEQDSDGDLVVERRNREEVIRIEHSASTSLRMVGLQVWRGALLLADWAVHCGPSLLRGATVLELGAGTGLTSIVAAMHAKEVVSTDVDLGGILDLIKANAALNRDVVKAKFTVLGLDFFAEQWSPEVQGKLKEVSLVFAADVIYDVDLTEAFVRTLLKVMSVPPKKTLFFALEKRYVFTTDDFESVAPVYEHFVSYLEHCRPKSWTIEQIPLDFPQYFRYERVKQLVLWKIAS